LALDDYSTISGGRGNSAGMDAAVAGGQFNVASGHKAAVGGGGSNHAGGEASTVGGGSANHSDTAGAVVSGGSSNTAGGVNSTICGGTENINLGDNSVIVGGSTNTLTSNAGMSMAFGDSVYINSQSRVAFFCDYQPGALGINRDDTDGGINHPIHVGTTVSNGNAAYLTTGGAWVGGSGKASRGDVRPLDGKEVLGRIENIPIDNWACKGTGERHIGPAAEDFHTQFEVGVLTRDGTRDTEHLAAADMAGVALVGVQELYRMVRDQQQLAQDLQQRDSEIQELKMRLTQMEAAVETILAQQDNSGTDKLASNR
jgi:hypothetical protein